MSQVDPYVVHLQDGALAEVGAIIGRFSASRLYFVVDESAYAASGAATVLEPCFQDRAVTRFTGFDLNPKLHDIERGIEQFRDADPELVIALGGGTAIDLGKLIGTLSCQDESARDIIVGKSAIHRSGPPLIAAPTTAGTGSEATHFAVAYVDGEKYSVADDVLLPDYAIVDSTLTHSLPAGVTASTGLDAFCQAIESIWAVGATDESIEYAIQSARLSISSLVDAIHAPTARIRQNMCRASHLAGKAINISKTTASHALSYFITSEYGVPHGIAVAVTLSSMLAYNAQVAELDCADPRGPEHVLRRIGLIVELLGVDSVAAACRRIEKLISATGCPNSLALVGIRTDASLQRLVSRVDARRLSNNPRRATSDSLLSLLTKNCVPGKPGAS
ncbi:MAG: phosphonoacetaldehyde reductase [Fuerstiella sp.]|nr:phosphonoacetaldehyde reductase [Fuerstiella sp.]MCP4507396.1 phosphonoacetaldehyde reductase [Fuerstiella sp.]MDG2128765.1 phosphonoacetaldehyde reductase [Fuerstiella sp.]